VPKAGAPLYHNGDKTLSVLAVGVSFRVKSKCPKLLETNQMRGNDRRFGVVSRACAARVRLTLT
jgi:hypothetical protein